MFPRDHWCNCIQQYELGNLERCAEIVMQAQCAMERNIGSNSNETFNQRGAAQCRESFSGTPSTNPLAKQPSKSNPKRDLLVAKSRREFATCFLQVALRVRPSSHGGFAGLGVDVTPDF